MGPSEVIDDAVVAINIHQQFPFARNAEDLYNCIRGLWRLDSQRAAKARYLFAVYQGIIKEVCEIHQCTRQGRRPRNTGGKDSFRKAEIYRLRLTTVDRSLLEKSRLRTSG